MELDNHIWILIGKKLAHEATDGEIAELEELARLNPDIRFYMDVLSGWWHVAEEKGQKEAAIVFNKQLEQIKHRPPDSEASPLFMESKDHSGKKSTDTRGIFSYLKKRLHSFCAFFKRLT